MPKVSYTCCEIWSFLKRTIFPFGTTVMKKDRILSTPFDEHADLLFDIGVQKIKIASGEITNLPFWRHVSSFKLPLIVSTGMSTNAEISDCLDVIFNHVLSLTKLLFCIATPNIRHPWLTLTCASWAH